VRADATSPVVVVVAAGYAASADVATADAAATVATTFDVVVTLVAYVAAAAVDAVVAIVCGCESVHVEAPWDQLTTKARKF
jgi:hypothetical protein